MKYLMHINTGSVDTYENWQDDARENGWNFDRDIERKILVEVEENIEGKEGYDTEYGEWREVK